MLTVVAQIPTPTIPWPEITPVLVLFAAGVLVLLLDTAGEDRLKMSVFAGFGITAAGAAMALTQRDDRTAVALGLTLILLALLQMVLTWLWQDRPKTLGALLSAVGFAAGFGVTAWQWFVHREQLVAMMNPEIAFVGTGSFMDGMVVVDGVSLFATGVVCVIGLLAIPAGFAYMEDRQIHRGEYYPLLLFAATGMALLVSSNDLLMVFLSVEILSFALYVMAALAKRDLNSQEASVKYFILGGFSSAILLYGIALMYGISGSTNITEIGVVLADGTAPKPFMLIAMVMLIVGFAFKTGMVPFHFWTPDVYQGSPTPVTGFMAGATKIAAFVAFVRIFMAGFAPLFSVWRPMVLVLAIASMLVGAVLAVVQEDLKRILAYSAIAHAGYIALGFLTLSPTVEAPLVGRRGVSGMLLYLCIYGVVSVGSFGVIAFFERRLKRALTVADVSGLGRRYPVQALVMGIFLLSLAGMPGTAGFIAKYSVFLPALLAGEYTAVIVAVVSSVISAFFYLRIIASMFVEDETDLSLAVAEAPQSWASYASIVFMGATIIAVGVMPSWLIQLAQQAASFAN